MMGKCFCLVVRVTEESAYRKAFSESGGTLIEIIFVIYGVSLNSGCTVFLVSLDVEINRWFYRERKNELSYNRNGEPDTSLRRLEKRKSSCKIVVLRRPHY